MGSARKLLNTFIIEATGNDIWNESDDFGFLYREAGNCSLEGVLLMPTADAGGGTIATNAKMGIMIRESLSPDSKFFAIVRQKDGYVMAYSRIGTGETANIITTFINASIDKFKMDVADTTQKVYYHNGTEWILMATLVLDFGLTPKIGFCFAMIGDTAGAFVQFVNFTDNEVPVLTKPINLIGHLCSYKSATTNQPGGQTNNKPLNLIGNLCSYKSASSASTTTAGGKAATSGFNVFSFGGKAGLFYSQTSAPTLQMKITANVGASTISDEAWAYNPQMWNGSAMATPTRAWKINDMGDWKTTALTNISVANYIGIPLTVTKIFYFVDEFTKVKMFQQIIQVY